MCTLYIVGNGFDRYHDLPTSYSNFYTFLKNNGKDTFIRQLETYFGSSINGKSDLWSDLEVALGKYSSIDSILNSLTEDLKPDLDHMSIYVDAVEDTIEWGFVPIRDQFKDLFRDWILSIDLTKTQKKSFFQFSNNDIFFTFNYTNTLEKVYNIDKRYYIYMEMLLIKKMN